MTHRLLVVSEPGFAGVKRHVVDLLLHLDTERWETLYLYSDGRTDGRYADEIEQIRARGVTCRVVPMTRNLSPLTDLRCLLSILREIRAFRPDLVHCHSSKAGFLGRLAARLSGLPCPTIYTPNALPCYHSRFYHALEKLAGRWTDSLLAVSESEARDIHGFRLVPPERVHVFPMGIDLGQYPPPRAPRPEARVLGACARICLQKNALLFFRAGIALLERHPELRLLWIGDFSQDQEADEVRSLLAGCSVRDRIEITGWVDNPLEHMQRLDLFCMLSRFESFGFVTADAMMLGVPVLATPASGTVEMVRDGETGLMVAPEVPAIVAGAERLLGDAELRARLAARARESIERRYELGSCLEAIYRHYEELLIARSTSRTKAGASSRSTS